MIRNILYFITNYLRVRVITGDNHEPYLERYRLFGFFGRAVFIHRFVASDPERGLHDHPWQRACSLIVSGGYCEIRPEKVRVVRAPAINWIRGDDFHRVVLDNQQEAWSIFIHGKRVKGWGFQREGQFFPYTTSATDHTTKNWWKSAPRGRDLRRPAVTNTC